MPVSQVPARTWVSRVEPSHFDAATAYVSFDGHRNSNFKPYVFKTTDFGATWTNITGNLPQRDPVYVVKEDLRNPSLLFVGTEFGVYATIDGGARWHKMMTDMPTVAVHDLVIHPRDNDLIAATHGRSLWILDDITPLQQLTPAVLAADAHAFTNRVATIWKAISRGATRGHLLFQGRNPLTIAQRPPANSPSELQNSATVTFYVAKAPAGPAKIEITSADARTFTADVPVTVGINRYFWPLRFGAAPAGGGGGGRGGGGRGGGGRGGGGQAAAGDPAGRAGGAPGRAGGAPVDPDAPPPIPQGGAGAAAIAGPGTYRVKITVGEKVVNTTVVVRADPDAARVR